MKDPKGKEKPEPKDEDWDLGNPRECNNENDECESCQ